MQLIQEMLFIATLVGMGNFHSVAFLNLQSNWESLTQPDVEEHPSLVVQEGKEEMVEGSHRPFPLFYRELVCAIEVKSVPKQQNPKQFNWHLRFQSVKSFIN